MTGIIRAPRPARGWTEIKNTTARDARLSYRARGVLLRLLSNEDGFRMTADDLAREAREGRSAVLTALKELRQAGYLIVNKIQGQGGRWRTETFVFDTPQQPLSPAVATGVQFPNSGSPNSGQPAVGSPDPIKDTYQVDQQLKTTTTTQPPTSGGGGQEEIEQLIEAAIWAQEKIEPIRNPGGFRATLFARLASPGGISVADRDTYLRWQRFLKNQDLQAAADRKDAAEKENKVVVKGDAARSKAASLSSILKTKEAA